jgi:adenylate cyclase
MDPAAVDAIAQWIVSSGLAGTTEHDLLHGFCARCQEAGLHVARALMLIDTLHPVYEGRAFRWRNDGVAEAPMLEYGRTNQGEAAANWQQSVFYHVLQRGEDELRVDLLAPEPSGFAQMDGLKQEGHTDVLVLVHRFNPDGVIGEMDCVYSYWCSRAPAGFEEAAIAALRRLVPALALAMKAASLARIAGTLVEVYLGRDAGRRVLSGRIQRGIADRISAVLWFSDLRGYTTVSDRASPDELLPLLNDYAEAVIAAVHDAGGDVLKLIGDGVLAIFKADEPADACACALKAKGDLRRRLVALNQRRLAEGRPVTEVYLGLHIGEVFYGNIGSAERLDFTVIGPAVNEVSRVAAMCRSVDRNILVTAEFLAASRPQDRAHFVSVGRYALRGVGSAKELYTSDVAPAVTAG